MLSAGQREYNRKQRETLRVYKDVDRALHGDEVDASSQEEPHEGLAINLSNIANVFLLVIKVILHSTTSLYHQMNSTSF